MKKEDKVQVQAVPVVESEDIWPSVIVIICMLITLVTITRLYVDASIISDMITHYTLRGRDVLVKDNSLVFINN